MITRIEEIQSKEDLAGFVEALRQDLIDNTDEWENPTLDMFLQSMQAWIEDSDGYFKNMGKEAPPPIAWRFVADVLYAGKIYE